VDTISTLPRTTAARVSAPGSSDRRPSGSSSHRSSAFLIARQQVPFQLEASQRHRLPQSLQCKLEQLKP